MDVPPTARTDDSVAARLDAVEARLAIIDVIAGYGPAVDAGRAEDVAGLWAEDGRYSFTLADGTATLDGRDAMRSMVEGDMHQGIIADGSAHLMGLPVVEIAGDFAVATGHSMLMRYQPRDGSFRIDRIAANRWELRRTAGVWQVIERVNLLLDGRESARFLLGRVGEHSTPHDIAKSK